MARGNMTSVTRGTTGISLNDRFTIIGNVRSPRGSRSPRARSRGGPSVVRQPSLRNRQLLRQMETRPGVQAALRLRRTPMKPNIKQRLSMRGVARRGFKRSNSVGSLYTEPLKSEPISKFRRTGGSLRGRLRRSSSMNSLNNFSPNNNRGGGGGGRGRASRTQSRSRSRGRESRSRSRSRSRSQSRSRTPQRNAARGGGGQRGGGRGRGTRVFRRNSVSGFDNTVMKRDARSFKRGRGNNSNRSRGARGAIQQQRGNLNNVNNISNNVRRGRSSSRNRRNSMNSTTQNQRMGRGGGGGTQGGARRGMTAGRARRGARGARGRGGNNTATIPIKKEQLDAELDSYMAGSKSQLDRDLDTYMSNTNMDYQ